MDFWAGKRSDFHLTLIIAVRVFCERISLILRGNLAGKFRLNPTEIRLVVAHQTIEPFTKVMARFRLVR